MKKSSSLLSMTLALASFCMNAGKAQEKISEVAELAKQEAEAVSAQAPMKAQESMQPQTKAAQVGAAGSPEAVLAHKPHGDQTEEATQTDTTATENTPKEEAQYNVNAAKQSAKKAAKESAKEAAGIPARATGQVIKTNAQARAHQAEKEAAVKEVHSVHAAK